MAKHSISLSDDVSGASNTACLPQNENRDFSNLCEVALREYLEARNYLAPTSDDEERQILATLALAMKKAPAIKAKLQRLSAQAVREKYVEAGTR